MFNEVSGKFSIRSSFGSNLDPSASNRSQVLT